jgi:hypothetical protein
MLAAVAGVHILELMEPVVLVAAAMVEVQLAEQQIPAAAVAADLPEVLAVQAFALLNMQALNVVRAAL